MKEYKIVYRETMEYEYVVKANSPEEAAEMFSNFDGQDLYDQCGEKIDGDYEIIEMSTTHD